MILPDTLNSLYLRPGEIYLAENPTVITTVLGSCISITMHARKIRAGAICHALLPEGESSSGLYRYVDSSILNMIRMMGAFGVSRTALEVKMFGGADMLSANNNSGVKIGTRNIQVAREVLAAEGLTLAKEDVGGVLGRKILFHSHTGDVWLKRLRKGEVAEVGQ